MALQAEGCFENFPHGSGDAPLTAALVPGLGLDVIGGCADELAFGGLRDLDIDGTSTFGADVALAVVVNGFLQFFRHLESSFNEL